MRVLSLLIWLISVLGFLGLASEANGQVASISERGEKEYAPAEPGVLIVKLKPGDAAKNGRAVMEQVMSDIGASPMRPLFSSLAQGNDFAKTKALSSLEHVYELRYDTPVAPHTVANLIMQDDRVEYAEPRYRYTLSNGRRILEPAHQTGARSRIAPNDPQYSEMSHLRHVNMPEAWDIIKSSEGDVIIGIIDGGVDWEHDDLRGNVWRNTGEVENGVDDDRNGFVDDLYGWSFPDNSNDPKGLSGTPFNGQHGTMVAGVAVAVTDNNTGISGASWNARFIPVNSGCISVDNAVCFGYEGMLYAAREGAEIINVSWGGPDSFLGREIVRIVQEMGALVVVSAGNGGGIDGIGIDLDRSPTYPAAYEGVFVVGSTGKDSDVKTPFSNYGVSVDVFAPGDNLNSTLPNNEYTTDASGTSFSVPFVSGLAALVKTQNDDWTMEQVREQIRVTSIPIDEANDARFTGLLGSGRIDAVRALTNTNVPSIRVEDIAFTESNSDGAIQEGEEVEVTLDLFNYLTTANGVTYRVSTPDSLVTFSQSSGSIGFLASGSSGVAQFSFRLANTMPNDYGLNFNVSIQGDGFSSNELIDLTVNKVTHDTGVLQVSLTDDGNIGWSDFLNSDGVGFKYFGVNWLFEGGLIVGVDENTILSSVRNEEPFIQDQDFGRVAGSTFGVLPGALTNENGLVILGETNEVDGLGIRIHQESYADTRTENTNFIILRYLLSLPEGAVPNLDNVYVGLFMDWDLTTGGDFARYDAFRRLGMVQSDADSPILVLGTRLLSASPGVSYRSIRNSEIFDSRAGGDGFTDEEKWNFLSGGIQTESVDDDDVSTIVAAGPYQLFQGEEPIEVAFALVAATSYDNMRLFSDNAQRLWNQTIRVAKPNPVSTEEDGPTLAFNLGSAFPNPVHSHTSIRFSTPREGRVNLEVYDILGRKIRTLLDDHVFAGVHTVEWDRKNDLGSVVSSGSYVYRLTVSSPERTYSAARPLIVIR